MVKRITYKEAKDFLLPRHYSGRIPNIKYAYGLYENDILKAVCTFGKPASNSLCEGACGKEYKDLVFELNRLCRIDEYDGQLSQFVSACLRDLKKENLIIVSYSDTAMQHHGYIYQACNFIYTGLTKTRTDKYTESGKHSRHYDKNTDNTIRKIRSAKHRYIYFTNNKKHFLRYLNYKVLPYPKGDNQNYKLGEYLKDKIIQNNI